MRFKEISEPSQAMPCSKENKDLSTPRTMRQSPIFCELLLNAGSKIKSELVNHDQCGMPRCYIIAADNEKTSGARRSPEEQSGRESSTHSVGQGF